MLVDELRKITNTIKEDWEFEYLKRKMLDAAREGKVTTGYFNIQEECPITFTNGHLWEFLRREGILMYGSYTNYELRWD